MKASELENARKLYAEAYEPVRAAGTLDALDRQRELLAAADTLESRALAIHEWPIDEGTVAPVITIATSVRRGHDRALFSTRSASEVRRAVI